KTIKLDQQKRLAIPINGFQKTWKIKLGHVQWPCHVQQFFLRLTAMVKTRATAAEDVTRQTIVSPPNMSHVSGRILELERESIIQFV
ncbi:MAG: hypothetical protein RIE86_05600, partial [Imperialibacter sp.]|uniref:hypothetical protein n=1 Tax=Imperialibacter sp. TaxID=2038411 RepID=UPI0032EF2A15